METALAAVEIQRGTSRRFILKGGKHDAHGKKKKKGSFKLRLFPKTIRWEKGAWTLPEFDPELDYDGEVYGFPEVQNETDPFLVFLRASP